MFQVVRDCIEDVCNRLNILDQVEVEEYTLFLRTSKKLLASFQLSFVVEIGFIIKIAYIIKTAFIVKLL